MKKIIAIVLMAIIIAPCMMIVNESDVFWPNLLGLAYLGVLLLIAKSRNGNRILRAITKTLL